MPTRRHKVWLVVVTTSQIDLKSAWLVDLKFHHLRDFCPSAGSNPGQHKAKIWRPAPPRPRKAFLRIIRSCFLVAVDVGGFHRLGHRVGWWCIGCIVSRVRSEGVFGWEKLMKEKMQGCQLGFFEGEGLISFFFGMSSSRDEIETIS